MDDGQPTGLVNAAGPTSAPVARSILDEALLVGDDAFGELVLVRHAQQGDNLLGDPARPRAGDVALSELGERQAADVAAHLASTRVDAVVSSDLHRARQTAEKIAAHHGLDLTIDERLREIDAFQMVPPGGRAVDVLGPAGLADMRERFLQERRWDAFPLCEPVDAFRSRVASAFSDIGARYPEHATIVIVSHTVVMNQFIAGLLGMSEDIVFFPAHASISRIGRGAGRLAIRALNEHHFLGDPITH
jgi:2,3-bisphosphoglycerate-dependent phosphoglycerate mutase